jgi:PilZ domain
MGLRTIEECATEADSVHIYPATASRFSLRYCQCGEAMMQRSKTLQPAKKRAVRRCSFVASVEVTDVSSGARLSARTSELGMGGCYVDALNPFPAGTLITLRILRDKGAFEAKAKVAYSDAKFGMGVAFTEMARDQKAILEGWLAEIVSLLRPIS